VLKTGSPADPVTPAASHDTPPGLLQAPHSAPNLSLDARLSATRRPVIICLSGGGDSMALLDLYCAARATQPGLPPPVAVTVDHGLRADFAAEAALARQAAAARGVPWRLVAWRGPKPETGMMAAARRARHDLIADAARVEGAHVALTGHTLDDARETEAMRAARRPAPPPIDTATLHRRQTLFLRPLLHVTRGALRAHLARRGIAFSDDPSNADMRRERARVRAVLVAAGRASAEEDAADAARFEDAREARAGLAKRAAAWVAASATLLPGRVELRDERGDGDGDARRFALRHLAAALGGADQAASAIQADAIDSLFAGPRNRAFTVQHCRFAAVARNVVEARIDPRHAGRAYPSGEVALFTEFCPTGLLPLADALAQLTGAPLFSPVCEAALCGDAATPGLPNRAIESRCGPDAHWQARS
jgi:tRNA(Ile)-lysidine synthase